MATRPQLFQQSVTNAPTGTSFLDISGATSKTYVPTDGDAARPTHLRAVAKYTDSQGQNKTATSSTSALPVAVSDPDNQPLAFPDQDPNTEGFQTGQTRYVLEEMKGAPAVSNKDGSASTADPNPDLVTAIDVEGTDPDTLTYTLGGTDASLFEIDWETAQVSLRSGMKVDFEAGDTHTVTVTATDPSLESDTMTLTINVVKVDEKPTFSRKGLSVQGPATDSYPENETRDVASFMARGSEAPGATWSLEGADASEFMISAGGVLTFRSTPNYEAPTDADSNNVYNVTVKASSDNISDTMSVTVTVTNIDEPGSVSISSPGNEVKVGVQRTAELDEGDEEVVTGWQWASGASATGNFTNISGATNNTYTPVDGDVGYFLRITVAYTDASHGSDSLSMVTATAVEAATVTVPGTDGTLALSLSQPIIGESISATLTDADNPDTTTYSWEWERSTNNSIWTTVSGATGATYTVGTADAGNYLRATLTYTDDSGAGQTATAATTRRVPVDAQYDTNFDGTIDAPEVLAAVTDYFNSPGTPSDQQRVLQVVALYFAGLNQ